MRFLLLALGILASAACVRADEAGGAQGAAGAEPGIALAGPFDYCGSAVLLRLESGETITGLAATGLHGRVFAFTSAGRRVDVAETDIARPASGEIVSRSGGVETVRLRGPGTGFAYALQAQDGRHVRLDSASFDGSAADLALVGRFRLKALNHQPCNDPGRLL